MQKHLKVSMVWVASVGFKLGSKTDITIIIKKKPNRIDNCFFFKYVFSHTHYNVNYVVNEMNYNVAIHPDRQPTLWLRNN